MKKVPGAVDVGLSTRGRSRSSNVELNRGLAGSARHHASGRSRSRCVRRSPGIEAGDWVGSERRDARRRRCDSRRRRAQRVADLAAAAARRARAPTARRRRCRSARSRRSRQSVGPAQIDHLDRERVVTVEANTQGRSLNEVHDATSDAARRRSRCRRPTASRRAARREHRPRCSGRSSSRSASRCC